MGEKVCVNADRSTVVPCDSAEAAYSVSKEDADKLTKAASKAQRPAEDKAVTAPERKSGR